MLASGGKYRRMPYKRIETNPSEFMDSMYFPQTVTLKDPQNMQMKDIKTFLSHIQARETVHGTKGAFRFKRYWHQTELRDAAYAAEASPSSQGPPIPSAGAAQPMPMEPQGSGPSGTCNRSAEAVTDYGRSNIQAASAMPIAEPEVQAAGPNSRAALRAASSRQNHKPHNAAPIVQAANAPIVIDQAEMSRLMTLGIPTSVPINGPYDGQPMYYLPQAEAGLVFTDNIGPTINHGPRLDVTDNIDPTIM